MLCMQTHCRSWFEHQNTHHQLATHTGHMLGIYPLHWRLYQMCSSAHFCHCMNHGQLVNRPGVTQSKPLPTSQLSKLGKLGQRMGCQIGFFQDFYMAIAIFVTLSLSYGIDVIDSLLLYPFDMWLNQLLSIFFRTLAEIIICFHPLWEVKVLEFFDWSKWVTSGFRPP